MSFPNSEFIALLRKARAAYSDRRGDKATEAKRIEAAHAVIRTPQFMAYCRDNAVLPGGKSIPSAKFMKMIAFNDSYSEFRDNERMIAKFDAVLEDETSSSQSFQMCQEDILDIHGHDYATRHFRFVRSSHELNILREIFTTRMDAVESYVHRNSYTAFRWPEAPKPVAVEVKPAPKRVLPRAGAGDHDDVW